MSISFDDICEWIKKEANFFRIHLLFFLLVPLVSAGIFFAANGRYPIPFIDALFLCYSALTVTGLSTVNLSTCTVFQQVILYVLMGLGDVSIVAWVMVLIRKHYFVQHLESLKRKEKSRTLIGDRFTRFIRGESGNQSDEPHIRVKGPSVAGSVSASETITAYETHQFHGGEGIGAALVGGGSVGIGLGIALGACVGNANGIHAPVDIHQANSDDNDLRVGVESPKSLARSFEFIQNPETEGIVATAHSFTSSPRSGMSPLPFSPNPRAEGRTPIAETFSMRPPLRHRRGVPIPRRQTVIQPPKSDDPYHSQYLGQRGKDQGLGGFPGPLQLAAKLARRYFPRFQSQIEHIFTRSVENTKGKSMRWLTEEFSLLRITRNSDFDTEDLSDEELERLGGLEYMALDFLSFLVIAYFVLVQLISIVLIAPWLSTTHKYDELFASQSRLVNKSWFIAFQIMGSYTGGGMSLVDAGMVPFQQAYLMIFAMLFAILAGNHGLPIFLRFIIWILTKFVKDGSNADKTLHFLLDHPRRCFLYLFPSHVTWFLLATLIFFTAIEWSSFIVLDLGLSVTDSIPGGTRAVAGLFQSFAIRASGFAIVPLASLAPSFQFLCVIMMYIAVFPVAMSIRSTNVYEERSLGVFELPPADEDEEPRLEENTSRRERIGKYFGWHLRRQVAYDIWWLVCAIFIVCIVERTIIMDDTNAPWFNIFRIIFELVSAFGGIGLTLGIPTQNYSFSGAFAPLSKLVVIVIMVRGRHRGLPVAIDRAILLPQDLVPAKREGEPDVRSSVQADVEHQTISPAGPNQFVDAAEKGKPIGSLRRN